MEGERWSKGDSMHQIGKQFDRSHTSAATGDIGPLARQRSRLALTLAEREEISRAFAVGEFMHCVAARLGRATASVSSELYRNGGKSCYRAARAYEAVWERARRPKPCKLASNPALAQIVKGKPQLQNATTQLSFRH